MSTMQAQPGTPQALINTLIAPNPTNNTSIQNALAYQAWATQLGVGFDSLVVIQTDMADEPVAEFTIPQLAAMGIDQTIPLNVNGAIGDNRYVVNLERILIAGFDGFNSYLKVFAVRHPGASPADAFGALIGLPIVGDPLNKVMNKLKSEAALP